MDVKLHYYPDTDSLYVDFKSGPGVETVEVTEGLNVDLDRKGGVVGFDIDHASRRLDLPTLGTTALPLHSMMAGLLRGLGLTLTLALSRSAKGGLSARRTPKAHLRHLRPVEGEGIGPHPFRSGDPLRQARDMLRLGSRQRRANGIPTLRDEFRLGVGDEGGIGKGVW